ncbi:MAG: ArnT family glycosyltransferase [Gemmobacter sp.]|uniref:ArnT family glycosyltransferase n=1 Tax=Gemmobacter sp. TaxID=1898957 RepID=UPI00391D2FAD
MTLLDRTELSTDEAQYWFWGQELGFGAYSKPPLIGWLIRLATEIMGQSVWAVRLPAVGLHALTAVVLYQTARRLAPDPLPMVSALSYLVAPAVALGSAVMTTDTPMLLSASVALLAQVRLAEARAAGHTAPMVALGLGLALGLGVLAKHAMLFWMVGAGAAALLSPAFRPKGSDLLLALAMAAVVVAPHVLWLYRHDFITASHVADITRGTMPTLWRPLRFVAEQFAVARCRWGWPR